MQKEAWMATDSLSRELNIQAQYLENMIAVIEGRLSPESLMETPEETPSANGPSAAENTNPSLERLRIEVAEEDAFFYWAQRRTGQHRFVAVSRRWANLRWLESRRGALGH